MIVARGSVHRSGRASLFSVLGQPLDDIEVPERRGQVQRVCRRPLVPVVVEPPDHLHVPLPGRQDHRLVRERGRHLLHDVHVPVPRTQVPVLEVAGGYALLELGDDATEVVHRVLEQVRDLVGSAGRSAGRRSRGRMGEVESRWSVRGRR